MADSAVTTVLAWHEALNTADADRLVALSTDDVEVGGPQGSGSGGRLLRDWVARAGVRLEPGRVFARAGTVVVEERAEWRSAATGEVSGRQDVASVFEVRDGRVARVVRHADVGGALAAAGLDESDLVGRGESARG
jgi:ketosteroid isomerase-like protein